MLTRLHYFCFSLAVYLTLVILMAALGANIMFTALGVFLFDRFHLAALYLPIILVIGGLLLRAKNFSGRTLLLLWLSPVLFLTLALSLQILTDRTNMLAPKAMIEVLGRFPAGILFLFIFSLEVFAFVKLSLWNSREDKIQKLLDALGAKFENFMALLGLFESDEQEGFSGKAQDEIAATIDSSLEETLRKVLNHKSSKKTSTDSQSRESNKAFPLKEEPITQKPKRHISATEELNNPEVSLSPQGTPSVKEELNTLEVSLSRQGNPSVEEELNNPEVSLFRQGTPSVKEELNNPEVSLSRRGNLSVEEELNILDVSLSPQGNPSVEEELNILDVSLAPQGNPSVEEELNTLDVSLAPQGNLSVEEELNTLDTSLNHPSKEIPLEPQGSIFPEEESQIHAKEEIWDAPETEGDMNWGDVKYNVPSTGLLQEYPDSDSSVDDTTLRGGEILEETLSEFKIEARVTGIRKGPVITMYELLPSPGVKISSIVNLQDNIALRLAANRVRIVAPIPGKHAIGIEVPNKKRSIVSFSSMVKSEEFQNFSSGIPVILGKDISGGNQVIDLTRTPHLLIAGATGSGKSVCVNSLIASILYARSHHDVNLIMVDPKIVELKLYNGIPHLLTPVITEPKRAIQALQWCLYEMERRYSLLDSQGVRDMGSYNRRVKERKLATLPLPYIVVIVDEFADLMATSGKELEGIVARLAAMSRAVGIHLVLATQRPSVDVITGLIKANFPSRIAFMVAGKTDSRIIIDTMGAEKLLGRGDMLFTSAWNPFPSRVQGAFLSEDEVEHMAEYVKTLGEPDYIDDEIFFDDEEDQDIPVETSNGDDPMYKKALEIVISSRKASASYLQRRLKIGYNRAARLVEEMERRGIVGPANGSKPRDLIHIPDSASLEASSA